MVLYSGLLKILLEYSVPIVRTKTNPPLLNSILCWWFLGYYRQVSHDTTFIRIKGIYRAITNTMLFVNWVRKITSTKKRLDTRCPIKLSTLLVLLGSYWERHKSLKLVEVLLSIPRITRRKRAVVNITYSSIDVSHIYLSNIIVLVDWDLRT